MNHADFILREGNQVIQAIQVTTNFSNEEVKNREINGLVEAMIAYNLSEGLILTENEQDTIKMNGFLITITPIWKWLILETAVQG